MMIDTSNPYGKALMYEDSEEESYPLWVVRVNPGVGLTQQM